MTTGPLQAAGAATVQEPGRSDGIYALLTDGTTVLIRPAGPMDADAVSQMHAQMSPSNIYLRFFSMSPQSADREAKRVTRPQDADHCALLAWLGNELVGVASYEPTGKPGVAEIAFAVTDHMHGRGVATLLLDHLVSTARLRSLRAFTAETLANNVAMLRVFANAGLEARRQLSDGVIETTFPLPADESDRQLHSYLESLAMRERFADVASLAEQRFLGDQRGGGGRRMRGGGALARRRPAADDRDGGRVKQMSQAGDIGEPLAHRQRLQVAVQLPIGFVRRQRERGLDHAV